MVRMMERTRRRRTTQKRQGHSATVKADGLYPYEEEERRRRRPSSPSSSSSNLGQRSSVRAAREKAEPEEEGMVRRRVS